jgi:hypothetical protein
MSFLNAAVVPGRKPVAAAVALAVGFVAMALPASAVINDRVKRSCKGDYQRLCPSYKVGSSQLRACMESKQSSISWGCIEALMDSGEVDKKQAGKVSGRR